MGKDEERVNAGRMNYAHNPQWECSIVRTSARVWRVRVRGAWTDMKGQKKPRNADDSLFFRARDIRACTDSATRSALLARP